MEAGDTVWGEVRMADACGIFDGRPGLIPCSFLSHGISPSKTHLGSLLISVSFPSIRSRCQVPGAGPPEDDDPPTISFSHVEALEESPVLHESWRWTEGAEDREIGKKGPFVASMERYTVAWITD